jgi:hypothetical protein
MGPFTGQNRNSKCGSGIQHKHLGGLAARKGLGYQTYIKMLLRSALERERVLRAFLASLIPSKMPAHGPNP